MRHPTRGLLVGLALFALLGGAGCSSVGRLSAGPTFTPETSREPLAAGVGLRASKGVGLNEDDSFSMGLELGLRANFTARSQVVALGEGAYFTRSLGKRSLILVDGGLHLAFERYDDRLLVGAGPYASMAVGFELASREYFSPGVLLDDNRRERTLLTLGPSVELDARFSRPSAIPFFGLQVGLAWSSEHLPSDSSKPRDPRLPPAPPNAPSAPATSVPADPPLPAPPPPPPPTDVRL